MACGFFIDDNYFSSKIFNIIADQQSSYYQELKAFFGEKINDVVVYGLDVIDLSELNSEDFMFCYDVIKKAKDTTNYTKSNWQELDRLFKADPRFNDKKAA